MVKGDQRKEDKEVLKRRKILEEPFKKVALEFLVTTAIVVILLYLGLLLISRTAGFRSLIAERLASEVGGSYKIGKSWFDMQLNLHASEIRSTGNAREQGQIDVDRLTAHWSMEGLLSRDQPLIQKIHLDGISILAIHVENSGWQPEVFQFLEEVNGFGRLNSGAQSEGHDVGAKLTTYEDAGNAGVVDSESEEGAQRGKDARKKNKLRTVVEVSDSSLNVIGPGGQRLANFGNLAFNYVPTFNEGLEVQLYQLSGDYVLQNTRIPRQKIDVEVLHADDEVIVRKLRAGAQMLMRLSKAFGKSADVDAQAMAVLPPPNISRPVSVEPKRDAPHVVTAPMPSPEVIDSGDEAVAVSISPEGGKRNSPEGIPEPTPSEPRLVYDHRPVFVPAASVGDASEITGKATSRSVIDGPIPPPENPGKMKQDPRPADAGPVSQSDVSSGVESGSTQSPQIVGREPTPRVMNDLNAPESKSVVPMIISETVSEKAPKRQESLPSQRNKAGKPDESVVSEIERVLQEALDVRRKAGEQRQLAHRKFAGITNDVLTVSNEVSEVNGEELNQAP